MAGLGVDADRDKAIELYRLSADAGYQPARDNLDRLQAAPVEEPLGGKVYPPSKIDN